ncbi:MAG: hypothetical protein QNJ90_09355, partial [Planctomycetota bacterium]|nr:hypothetical protein [Planctomycetota bacterium]
MRTPRLVRALFLPFLAIGLALAPGCGGGGGGGGDGGAQDPVVIPAPPTTPPPTTPPPTTPPPTTPPPTTPPPTDPPPTDPPPTDPPPTDPPPTTQPPPGVPALPTPPSVAGYAQVHGIAVDPETDTVFAIRSDTGALTTLASGDPAPNQIGVTSLRQLRGLAFDGPGNVLLAVTDGAPGSDDVLHAVNPGTAEALMLGTITGYDAIEALAYHGEGPTRALYAVDTEQDVLLRLAPQTGLPTLVGSLGAAGTDLRGLASVDELLIGIDAARGDVVTIDTATGTATRRVTLASGALRGCAWAPGTRVLRGVAADDTLRQIDLEGSWIGWDQVKGLAYDPAGDALYGLHTGYGLVFHADVATGWRQPLVQVQDAGLEGLAFDTTTSMLHAVSRTTGAHVRVRTDGAVLEPTGTITQQQATRTGLAALAFAQGKLYAIDTGTSMVVEIDPATRQSTTFTTVAGHGGLQSLAYDEANDRLLAYADATRTLLQIPRVPGAPAEVVEQHTYTAIGGLAYLPAARRLLGSDLTAPGLQTLLQLTIPGLGYDEVRSLSLDYVRGGLTGFDNATERYLVIRTDTGAAEELSPGAGLRIEGLTSDPLGGRRLGIDAAEGSLYAIDQEGRFTRIGPAGALSGVDVRALAFDPRTPPGVLYGFDNATRRLVAIDLTSAAPTPIGGPIAPSSIEALALPLDTPALLAIDRTTRTLMELDLATGAPTPIAQVALEDVRGMCAVPGTEELLVVDTTLDQVSIVDRFTGDILDVFAEARVHRGTGDGAPATLVWPRGDVRPTRAGALIMEVSIEYEDDADLVIRAGNEELLRERFVPEVTLYTRPLPAAALKALRAGAEVTWGLEFRRGRKPITTTCSFASTKLVDADLAALAANAYLRKQRAHVIATRRARALLRHGFAGDALLEATHAVAQVWTSEPLRVGRGIPRSPAYVPADREVKRAARAVFGKQAREWSADALIRALTQDAKLRKALGFPN